MIPLQFEPTSQNGCIAIPDEDFDALLAFDGYNGPEKRIDLTDTLQRIPGVTRVDFSGHYGALISLTLDLDEPAALDKVKLAINEVLTLARAWVAEPTRYLVTRAAYQTGALVLRPSPLDLRDTAALATGVATRGAEQVYAVTPVGPPSDRLWMIRTYDLMD